MSAIAFSEHYNIFEWIRKKQECDKAGIKYIHGVEAAVCNRLEDDDRGCHIGLYARNFEGVLELNQLISNSTSKGKNEDKTDRHAYYNPRISLEELMNTSKNIIVTSACLASPLSRWFNKPETNSQMELLLTWMTKNKERCFLEIQYHDCESQKNYNIQLFKWSNATGIPLIAGTDTHSSNSYKAECRKILQKSKDSFYGEEDEFDLTWKTFDELVMAFSIQNILPESVYMKAIENTNRFADMIDDFKLDKTFKYPDLYGDEVNDLFTKKVAVKYKQKIKSGIIDKDNEQYLKNIKEELSAFKAQGMESFMLFMSELVDHCNNNDIPYGFCRGSVGGSTVAYMLDIIDVDPIKWGTVFSRFCNADRISLADIDIDFAPNDRKKVYEYIINRFGTRYTSYIAQFGTLKDRGTIDVLTKGLGYQDLEEVKVIKVQHEDLFNKYNDIIQAEVNLEEVDEDYKSVDFDNYEYYSKIIRDELAIKKAGKLKKSYDELKASNKDLFYFFDGLKGTIISKGHHPAGMIGSPITLQDNIGVFFSDGNESFPVATCAMKAVDSVNYVKFDILGLKTVGIIKDAYKYSGMHYLKSHEINWFDDEVWDDMITLKYGIFQFQGDYAFELLKSFQPKRINDMSLVNASLRPSGKSYRDRLIAREFNSNPSDEIDNLLAENNGYLVYQEDTIKFLTDICGFSGSLADTTRRCVAEDSLILMANGNRKRIQDVQINDTVVCINDKNVIEYNNVKNVFNNGISKTIEIFTQQNNNIVLTPEHEVLTQNGWKQASQLSTRDYLMTPKKIKDIGDGLRPNQRLPEKHMYLIGLLIGDGSLGNLNGIHFTNSEECIIEKYKECIISLSRKNKDCEFCILSQDGKEVEYVYSIYVKTPSFKILLRKMIELYELNCVAGNKKIPYQFMNYPVGGKLQHLLIGLFNTDGGYNISNTTIEYYTTSKELSYQIKSLLLKYDIYSYVFSKNVKNYPDVISYQLIIQQHDSIERFYQIIGQFIIGRKKDDYYNILTLSSQKELRYNYLIPIEHCNEIQKSMNERGISFSDIGNEIGGYAYNGFKVSKNVRLSDVKAKDIIRTVFAPKTYELLMAEYMPLKIINILEHSISNVYDLEIENAHNYVANELIVHNCIGKKDVEGLNEQLPKILDGYCSNSPKPRDIAEEEAKAFIQIISDSSEYQFGLNHSTGYSMNGYACARLRKYNPIEFITAILNNADSMDDIKNGTQLAIERGVLIKPIEFGRSGAEYTFDKKNNIIYKGIASIKYCNAQIAEELLELPNNKYDNPINLLYDVKYKTSVDSRQLKILIILGFFHKYGKNKKLLNISEMIEKYATRKQIGFKEIDKLGVNEDILKKYSNKTTAAQYRELDMMGYIKEVSETLDDKNLSVKEQVKYEMEFLETPVYINEKSPDNFYIVVEFKTYKDQTKPYVVLHNTKTGELKKTKVKDGKLFVQNPFQVYSGLMVKEFIQQFKTKNINGVWRKSDELEDILTAWEVY